MNDTLHRLFRYKAWANDELLTTLAALDASSPIVEPAIRVLNHSHVVDRIFAAHLRQRGHEYTSTNPVELPTLQALSAAMRSSGREYVDYVSTLDRAQLDETVDFSFTDGAAGCMSRAEMLLHVVNHGTGHRGQISALVLLNGIAPARDGFTTWLHETEASARRRGTAQAGASRRHRQTAIS